MGRALDAFRSFFVSDEWPVEEVPEHATLTTGFKGNNGSFRCFVREREQQEQVAFYAVIPVNVPEEKRPAMAEFITRANYGAVLGNFEMDYNDGEVRFKTSADVEGIEMTEVFVRNLVYTNMIMADRYFPGFMKVLFSDISPQLAVAEIEEAN